MATVQDSDNTKCWPGCRAVGTAIHCWWECDTLQLRWKTVWGVSCKTEYSLFTPFSIRAPWYLPRGVANFCPYKNLDTGKHLCSFIHNFQNLEAAKMSFRR